MSRKGGGGKAGFSIIEVVTALTVLVVIGAILLSSINPETMNDRARYDMAADNLAKLATAIAGYEATRQAKSFHQVVGVYPGKLSDLTTPITQAGKNICNVSYTASNVSKWAAAPNPFYGLQLQTKGTPIAPGFTLNDALTLGSTLQGPLGNSANKIVVTMSNVLLRDAQGLDLAVDGAIDGTKGTVQYTTVTLPTDVTTVKYFIYISATSGTPANC